MSTLGLKQLVFPQQSPPLHVFGVIYILSPFASLFSPLQSNEKKFGWHVVINGISVSCAPGSEPGAL
jgi:hypothetical protein